MIEYGPAHGLQWTQSIIVLTSNAGASRAAQIANERAQVRARPRLHPTVLFYVTTKKQK